MGVINSLESWMTKYKVGDRVHVYGSAEDATNHRTHYYCYGIIPATVVSIEWGQECLEVKFDEKKHYAGSGKTVVVHHKQLRKLRKKRKYCGAV
jgi:ribosomal protein L21E